MPGDQDASRGSLYLALVVANTTVPPIVYHTVTAEAVAAIPTQAETRADSGERLGALFDAHHQRLYRLARRFGLGVWLGLGAAAAYATSLQFVVDQAIASDSLCAATFTIAACILAELALRRAPWPILASPICAW